MVEVQGEGSSLCVAPAGLENAFTEEWLSSQAHCPPKEPLLVCPKCGSAHVDKNGHRYLSGVVDIQRYKCQDCKYRFSEKPPNDYKLSLPIRDCQLSELLQGATKKLDAQAILEKTCAGDASLISYAWQSKVKKGNNDTTVNKRVRTLRLLKKLGAKLNDPSSVEVALATEPMSPAKKKSFVKAYASYTKTMGIQWEPIKVKYEPKEPFIPTTEELNSLINASGKILKVFLQVALTTGARAGEIAKLKWTDIDVEGRKISINEAEKGSRNRTIPVPEKTIALIGSLKKRNSPYLFNKDPQSMRVGLGVVRKRLAETENNPRYLQIHLHTFRHYFGRETLRQTNTLSRVQYLLGHKSVLNTERYTHMIDFDNQKFYSAVATTIEELRKLAEDGWTYFQEIDGVKIFRKPR